MKRKLAVLGLGTAAVVAALSGTHAKSPASPSGSPTPSPIVSSPAPSPAPTVFVVSTPSAAPSPSPSVTVRPTSVPTAIVDPAPRSCGAGYYRNVDGDCISGPVLSPTVPADASAVCRDGTYSFSRHRQGTCSHHGGVAEWL